METSIKMEEDEKTTNISPFQPEVVESLSSDPVIKSEEKEADLKSQAQRLGNETGWN